MQIVLGFESESSSAMLLGPQSGNGTPTNLELGQGRLCVAQRPCWETSLVGNQLIINRKLLTSITKVNAQEYDVNCDFVFIANTAATNC